MVSIISRVREGEFWLVVASVVLPNGNRVGPHTIDLGADATDAEIEAAILALYL